MENAPYQTVYNTEMQIVARLERMEVRTTKLHYLWQNKSEIVIKIIKGNTKRRRAQRNIPKRVCVFGMVYKADIYSHNAGKDGLIDLERLTGDTMYISECLESEFYDLV